MNNDKVMNNQLKKKKKKALYIRTYKILLILKYNQFWLDKLLS